MLHCLKKKQRLREIPLLFLTGKDLTKADIYNPSRDMHGTFQKGTGRKEELVLRLHKIAEENASPP